MKLKHYLLIAKIFMWHSSKASWRESLGTLLLRSFDIEMQGKVRLRQRGPSEIL